MGLSSIFANEALVIPLFGICVAVIVYMWIGKGLDKVLSKTAGQKNEMIRLMRLMQLEVDEKKIQSNLMLLSLGVGSVFFLLLLPNIVMSLVFGIGAAIGASILPKFIIKSMYESRCNKFVDQMVDAMTLLANGVKAGVSLQQSMARVSENLAGPVAQEFDLIRSQMTVGKTLDDAMIELGERVPRPDVVLFVTAVNILNETGGNMAETFQTISSTIRERQKLEKKIDAMTQQGRTQGVILSLVPVGMLVMLSVVDPTFVKPMFTTTMGLILLLGVFFLIVFAGVVIKKIVTINV